MGDLLFFAHTSTPHRHRVPPEQLPERKEDDVDKAKKGTVFHDSLS